MLAGHVSSPRPPRARPPPPWHHARCHTPPSCLHEADVAPDRGHPRPLPSPLGRHRRAAATAAATALVLLGPQRPHLGVALLHLRSASASPRRAAAPSAAAPPALPPRLHLLFAPAESDPAITEPRLRRPPPGHLARWPLAAHACSTSTLASRLRQPCHACWPCHTVSPCRAVAGLPHAAGQHLRLLRPPCPRLGTAPPTEPSVDRAALTSPVSMPRRAT